MNPPPAASATAPNPYRLIKWLIWTYFLLLIYEGALRKWILPGLANPLLIVRDPVVILIYMLALSKGAFPDEPLVTWITGFGILAFLISLVAGVGNVLISLYGWRTDFLHLPLIFLMAKVLDFKDVRRLCIGLLVTAIPMAFLVMVQFKSPSTAWVNVGVGGTEGGQLDVGFGKIRPPGTFSFTNGLANYVSLVAACLFYAVIDRKFYPKWLLFSAAPAVGLMMTISGSRATVSAVVVSLAFLAIICLRNPSYLGGSVKFVLLALPGLWLVTMLPVFQEGIMVHTKRFGEAGGGIQHGIVERTFSDYLNGFYAIPHTPFFGMGLGMGTNAAAGMLGGGKRTFMLAEGEWERVVKEGGVIFGLGFLGLRVFVAVYLGASAWGAANRGHPLAFMVLSACLLPILNAQFGQPTALGFAVFGAGLCLSAVNEPETARPAAAAVPAASRGIRGRSAHAELLHAHRN